MEPKGGGRIHTPSKPPKDSSMAYDESEDLSYWMSKLEDLIKSFVRMIDLVNLEESMGHMENEIEENMASIFKVIKYLE